MADNKTGETQKPKRQHRATYSRDKRKLDEILADMRKHFALRGQDDYSRRVILHAMMNEWADRIESAVEAEVQRRIAEMGEKPVGYGPEQYKLEKQLRVKDYMTVCFEAKPPHWTVPLYLAPYKSEN